MEKLVETMQKAATLVSDKELAKNAQELVELMTFQAEGIEGATAFSPSWVRLVQSITDTGTYPDAGKLGDFVLGNGKDAVLFKKPLEVIPLALYPSRTFWDPVDKGSQKSLCSSPDGVMGRFGMCKSCEHSKFVEGKGSDCTQAQNVLWVTADLKHIFFQGYSKTSYNTGKTFSREFAKKGRQPYKTICSLDSMKSDKYKMVYLPVVSMKSIVKDETITDFTYSIFQYFKASREAYIEAFRGGLPKLMLEQKDETSEHIASIEATTSTNAPVYNI